MVSEQTLKLLAFPDTWCEGARMLAAQGDPEGLLPLVAAYEQPFEARRRCLLDAMEALQPVSGAHNIFDNSSGDQRRMAVHLMELFASNEHLSRLKAAVSDPDEIVRAQARSALAGQYQTPEWEATMISLLAHHDLLTRAQAVKSLARRGTQTADEALRARLTVEPDPNLKSEMDRIVSTLK